LLSRFHIADETIDFSKNSTWFDIKLLVESGSKNTADGIRDTTFRKTMKEVFKKNGIHCVHVGIPSKHFVHFRRVMGAIVAELAKPGNQRTGQTRNRNDIQVSFQPVS
jgi:hypothetical protein